MGVEGLLGIIEGTGAFFELILTLLMANLKAIRARFLPASFKLLVSFFVTPRVLSRMGLQRPLLCGLCDEIFLAEAAAEGELRISRLVQSSGR